jgi:hypothetical protein
MLFMAYKNILYNNLHRAGKLPTSKECKTISKRVGSTGESSCSCASSEDVNVFPVSP